MVIKFRIENEVNFRRNTLVSKSNIRILGFR